MSADRLTVPISTPESALRGKIIIPRPGHDFDEQDLTYAASVGAQVGRVISPEEGSADYEEE